MSKNSVIIVDLGAIPDDAPSYIIKDESGYQNKQFHLVVNHEYIDSSDAFKDLFILALRLSKALNTTIETSFDVKTIYQMMKKYIDPKPYEIDFEVVEKSGEFFRRKTMSQGRNYEEAVIAFLESKPEGMIATSIAETHEATGESLSSPILRIKGDWVVVNRTWLTVGACSILIDQDKVEVYSVNQEDGGDMGNISLDHQYALQASDELNEPSV